MRITHGVRPVSIMQAAFILIALLATVNIVVSCAFAVDKWQAQQNGRRIPRWHLVCLLWLAPFLPTVCMVWLHHKIRKRLFMTSSCLAGSLQSVGLVWWLMQNAKAETMTGMVFLGVLALVAIFIILWASALGIQLRRGCACEPSTVHGARAPEVRV